MENNLNRIKIVLAEFDNKTNKWLAQQINRLLSTIYKWCTNSAQPTLLALIAIVNRFNVKLEEFVRIPIFINN